MLHLHCGTASQIISGLQLASLNSRVFSSPGMGPNVAVLHVDDYNFTSGLLIFLFFLFFNYFSFSCCFFFKCCFMLEHLCVDLEQEFKEALATWVLVQIYTQSSFLK
jgi:hypothetical protein